MNQNDIWEVRPIDLYEGGEGLSVRPGGTSDGIEVVSTITGEIICDNQTYYPQALNPRHAHLIAAAPKMLEALEAALKSEWNWDVKARAAIAEARRES